MFNKADIIRLFDEKFDKTEKQIPANATSNDIYELIRNIFYDIVHDIEFEYPSVIESETDENEQWFDEYYNFLVPDWFAEIMEED